MTTHAVADLIRDIRITLDENSVQNEYLAVADDNMELDDIIRSKLSDAVRSVEEAAPLWMLEGKPHVPSVVNTNSDGSGDVSLPADFLRLVSFLLDDWSVEVNFMVEYGSDEAMKQKNKYIRGNPKRPICVSSFDATGARVLEFYSTTKANAAISKFLYVPIPVIDGDSISFSTILYKSVVNMCAGLTEIARGNQAAADVLFKIAESYYRANE
ncbi:MAG: hypothetical protein LBM61_07425 [Prevotellaceae bacterium]|jgi:hypothetical protein|nr:hypothetical protein [Prevotellaceae bacterium]